MPADLVTRLLLQNQEFDRNIKASQNQIKTFQKRVDSMGASVRSFVGGFAGMAGISFAFMDIAQKSIQFEKSLSSLRSLTGVTAEELTFFKNEAIKLGSTSTQTASQVVEAFQLIGSQKPELLKNKDALADVTKQAITLAEAAGMDVPEAAKALTGSLNQMGESSRKAEEYINILAAASQAGSADIPYLTKAIEKSGGAASSVGIKYNELVAAIEAIAPKITEASEAGTNLRNIFLVLESSSDKNLKPSVVGLSKAVENLAAKNMDATQMTKMFGRESVTAALALVSAKDDYNRYVEAITGTNTAIEQQKINNDNLAGSINAVSSAWEGFVLSLNKSNGFLSTTAKGLAGIISDLTRLLKTSEELKKEAYGESAKKISNKASMLYNNNIEDKFTPKRALELARSEYDSTEGYKVDKFKSDVSALETKLERLNQARIEIANMPGYYNRQKKGEILQEINDTKEQIKVLKEKIEIQKLANQNAEEIFSSIENEIGGKASTVKLKNTDILSEAIKKQKKVKIPVQFGSKSDISRQISELTERINAESNPEILTTLMLQRERLRMDLKDIEKKEKLFIEVGFKLKPIQADTPEAKKGKNLKDNLETYRQELNQKSSDNWAKETDKYNEGLKSTIDTVNTLSGAMQGLSGIVGESATGWLSWSVTLMQSIATALPSMRTLVAGNKAVAISGAAASSASIPIVGYITALASIAGIAAAFANLPSFANSGIIPGTFSVGDRTLIRANAGEMILNPGHQAKLFDLIKSPGNGLNSNLSGDVRFILEGEKLVGLFNSYNKKQRRGR